MFYLSTVVCEYRAAIVTRRRITPTSIFPDEITFNSDAWVALRAKLIAIQKNSCCAETVGRIRANCPSVRCGWRIGKSHAKHNLTWELINYRAVDYGAEFSIHDPVCIKPQLFAEGMRRTEHTRNGSQ